MKYFLLKLQSLNIIKLLILRKICKENKKQDITKKIFRNRNLRRTLFNFRYQFAKQLHYVYSDFQMFSNSDTDTILSKQMK